LTEVKLWLIRHLPPAIAPGVCYGRTDLSLQVPLHAASDAVIHIRKSVPAGLPVYSSPLRRCAELACVLSDGVIQDARLQEMDFGSWEMQAWEAIGQSALDQWAANLAGFRPPGGETGYELQYRTLDWLREVSRQHANMVVVTHAGVMRALQAHHQGLPGDAWLRLRYDYGQVLCLEFTSKQINAAPVQ
jgi:alpha-ribazole phosphatase